MQFNPKSDPSKLAYGVRDAIHITGISRTSLYARVKSGELRATKCGRKTSFLAADIAAFLAGLRKGGH